MPATDLGVTALSDERGGHHALWTSDSLTRKEDPRFLTGSRMGSVPLAGCHSLLGLGSRERGLRLSPLRYATDKRVG